MAIKRPDAGATQEATDPVLPRRQDDVWRELQELYQASDRGDQEAGQRIAAVQREWFSAFVRELRDTQRQRDAGKQGDDQQ